MNIADRLIGDMISQVGERPDPDNPVIAPGPVLLGLRTINSSTSLWIGGRPGRMLDALRKCQQDQKPSPVILGSALRQAACGA